jgi:membrane associated rhomboid family serine protease
MIPIGDTQPRRRVPIINYVLITLNVVVFLGQLGQGPTLDAFIYRWGAIPTRLATWPQDPTVLLTLVTSTFLHGGWLHLIGNMLYLGIFGDNVEDRLGHGRYLIFYLAGGILAGLAQVWFVPDSSLPAIGASGAVAAVLGAYMIIYPRSKVTVLVFIFFFIRIVTVPAVLVLGFWFVTQFFNGLFSLAAVNAAYAGGIAWWAHIGGFVVGMATGILFRRRPSPRRKLPYTTYYYYR